MSTYARPKGKRKSRKSSADFTTVYLIHFNKAYRHARHYIGFTTNLDKRITDHLCGMGARLMEVITNAGIEWRVARTWQGDRRLERRLKGWHNAALLCPLCSGKEAMSRGNFTRKIQRFDKHAI
jgi:predicted GIY-YIG superfamily endonuclease